MKTLPHIFVRDFAGPDISYRIPVRRARNYWYFLDHVLSTFNKPWERYTVHLHLDNDICKGRVSASEWDVGGYFEHEFLVDNKLVLFAHFEELDEDMVSPGVKIEDDDGTWKWAWHDKDSAGIKRYDVNNLDDDLDEWDLDPYPPSPTTLFKKRQSNDNTPTPSSRSTTVFSAYSSASSTISPTPEIITVDDSKDMKSSRVGINIGRVGWVGESGGRGRGGGVRTAEKNVVEREETPGCPTLPSSEIITVNDSKTTKYSETGIIIGRAQAHCCRDPNIRPVVRAILNTKGAVCAFIYGKYAKRDAIKGDIQFPLRNVDFSDEFARIHDGERRLMAIRHELQAKLAVQRQGGKASSLIPRHLLAARSTATSSPPSARNHGTKTHQTVMPDGIVIGHAKPDHCRDPQNPPPVRAALNKVGSVVAYIPAEDSLRSFSKGRAQLQMVNVCFSEEFEALPAWSRIPTIKERILASLGEGQRKWYERRGEAAEVQQVGGEGEHEDEGDDKKEQQAEYEGVCDEEEMLVDVESC